MSDQLTSLRGKDAQLVLDNPAFKLAIETIREAVVTQWKDCPIRDREGAALLLQLAKLTDKFEAILIGMIETGKLSQSKIDLNSLRDESAPRQFMRRVVG